MSAEQFQPEIGPKEHERVYTHELQALKMSVQREVISLFCDGDIHNQDRVANWIDENSEKFRFIFDAKLREGGDAFIQRGKENPVEVAQEIALEMGGATHHH